MSEIVAGVGKANEWGKAEPASAAGGQVWSFTIPVATPSVNALNNIIWARREVKTKPEVLKWRNDASCFIPRIILQSDKSLIRVDTVFYYPFYHRNGTLRAFDSDNMLKALHDTIAWKVGFRDQRIKSGSWDSVDSPDEKVIVTLREIVNVNHQ